MRVRTELTFPGNLKDQAILCALCKQFNLIVNIIEASFSTDTGWALLVFDGSEAEIKKARDFLAAKGVSSVSDEQLTA
jgi:ABC-type methionine transport system ATPase subunit